MQLRPCKVLTDLPWMKHIKRIFFSKARRARDLRHNQAKSHGVHIADDSSGRWEVSGEPSQISDVVVCMTVNYWDCGIRSPLRTSWTARNPGRRFNGFKFPIKLVLQIQDTNMKFQLWNWKPTNFGWFFINWIGFFNFLFNWEWKCFTDVMCVFDWGSF